MFNSMENPYANVRRSSTLAKTNKENKRPNKDDCDVEVMNVAGFQRVSEIFLFRDCKFVGKN